MPVNRRFMKKMRSTGPADGIVEDAAPETILPMDDEYES